MSVGRLSLFDALISFLKFGHPGLKSDTSLNLSSVSALSTNTYKRSIQLAPIGIFEGKYSHIDKSELFFISILMPSKRPVDTLSREQLEKSRFLLVYDQS